MKRNKRLITVLNKLVELQTIESMDMKEHPQELRTILIALFTQLGGIRKKCRRNWLHNQPVGRIPKEILTISDRFFRAWMDVNDVITGKDRKYFLDSCEYKEAEAISTYRTVLEHEAGYQAWAKKHDLYTTNARRNRL
ncbi:MAG: hypothetical protein IPH20_26095 [Bacteroidales bacterium]|nr:hypothetical protein [Bacteroidales bacterium]